MTALPIVIVTHTVAMAGEMPETWLGVLGAGILAIPGVIAAAGSWRNRKALKVTNHQLTNGHSTNIRDDITGITGSDSPIVSRLDDLLEGHRLLRSYVQESVVKRTDLEAVEERVNERVDKLEKRFDGLTSGG